MARKAKTKTRKATKSRRKPRGPRKGTSKKEYTAARKARKEYEKAKKKPPGEGSRFKAVAKGAKARGARNPEAVAAFIMWKKYKKKGGAALIRKGKRDAKKAKKKK